MAKGRLESLGRDRCLSLLRAGTVGRLVTVDRYGSPDVFVVNYAMEGDNVVFRTDAGTKLRLADGHDVAFEVDGVDASSRTGWSVVVRGRAEERTTFDGPTRLTAARDLGVEPWAEGERRHWVAVHPRHITGRRIAAVDTGERV